MAWPGFGPMDSLNRIIWQVSFSSVFCLTPYRPVAEKVGISPLSAPFNIILSGFKVLAILLGLGSRRRQEKLVGGKGFIIGNIKEMTTEKVTVKSHHGSVFFF